MGGNMMGNMMGSSRVSPYGDGKVASSAEVDAYLEKHGVDNNARLRLKQISPNLQSLVIAQRLDEDMDPSASLISRIAKARMFAPEDGDWICEACKDFNFASNKNIQCRSCKAIKPGSMAG